jgi:DNA-binding FrmR family transcriptional regulator
MSATHLHTSHPQIAKRLKRAEGHLRSVVDMIDAGRPCLDIAQQLHAVERAVTEAKRSLIRDHLDHCLDHAAEETGAKRRASMDAFKEITKYL